MSHEREHPLSRSERNSENNDELRRLSDAYCAESLTDAELLRLETLLTDESARRAFLTRVEIHAGLHWLLRGACETPSAIPERDHSAELLVPAKSASTANSSVRWFALAAALLIAVWGAWSVWGLARQAPFEAESNTRDLPTFALLVNGSDMQWHADSPVELGQRLKPKSLELSAGLAEIEFDSGTVVVVEAPARFEPVDALSMKLTFGKVAVRMPSGKSGFVVDCPAVQVLDEGTEFGVAVATAGETVVQVYEGRVATKLKQATKEQRERRLTAGQSLEVVKSGQSAQATEFVEERFVRQLPQNSALPSNDSRHEVVYVRPASRPVAIDGSLTDWDLRRQFRSECRGEFGASYYLEGAAMYDREFLYVGAHVGDPAPLLNQYVPEDRPGFAWRGGGLHLRLAADAKFPWPLEVESEIHQRLFAKRNPTVPVSPLLSGLFMWYSAPRREACLLRYPELIGGVPQGDVLHENVRGAFQRDADGRGYVLEYAIPWSTLGVAAPPRPGDRWPAIWHVHWSADGQKHLGHLIDVTNPAERANLHAKSRLAMIFHRAVMWGRLEFESAEPARSD